MTNKVKKHIGFRYILIEIQMCIWFFCDWIHSTRSITQNQWQVHNIIHNIFKIPSDNSIICGSYCILFIEYILAGKVRLYQFRNLPKENKIIYKYSKDKYVKKTWVSTLDLQNIDETRNYLLEKMKYNDLMSEKYKKVCQSLNYF